MRVYIFYFILFLSSCQAHLQEEHLFTLPKEWPVPDSVSTKIKQRLERGHVEHFSVNGLRFRFQKSSGKNCLYDIQVNQDDKWITNLTLPMPRWTFLLTTDFDLDHSFDLFYLENRHLNIYFFDKANARFISKPMQFAYDHALLDSSNLVYGVNTHEGHDWNIEIFFFYS